MTANPPNRLPEISANDASGDTLEIYRSIEAALGVRLVNLVYRHLATVPGALDWAWAVVGSGFSNGIFRQRSVPLIELAQKASVDLAPTGGISLTACGLTFEQSTAVIATLDAYNQANPMNALSLRVISLALSAGWCPPASRVRIRNTEPLVELLPMGGLDQLDGETSGYMTQLAFFTTGEQSDLVPSLFRHFIPWPALLSALCDWLRPLHEQNLVGDISDRISADADAIARDIFGNLLASDDVLAAPDQGTCDALTATIAQFLPAICRMIVIGGLLRSSVSHGRGE
ncbi:MAG: hypothetical protein ACPGRZ_00925 [Alphaproteobacteria bacterium]